MIDCGGAHGNRFNPLETHRVVKSGTICRPYAAGNLHCQTNFTPGWRDQRSSHCFSVSIFTLADSMPPSTAFLYHSNARAGSGLPVFTCNCSK
jgi:hypothetical protein